MNTNLHTNTTDPTATEASYGDLWRLTAGQRPRYLGAILAIAIVNACMFSAPIIGGHAIDVINKQDFSFGDPFLLWASQLFAAEPSFTVYLWAAA